ncbi:MAG TPA: peptidylprolyl isomerase [Geobacteraceae bacterium]|nr:peptidylprolyl isomerase [Geobacteraceae bacterium]
MYFSKCVSSKSLVAVFMLLLFNSACSVSPSKVTTALPPADPSAAELKTTVARVNGKEIARAELNQAKKIILANKPGLQIPPLLQKEFEMQALNQLISSELLFQASHKLDIKDLDKQAEDKLAEIKKRFPDPKDYARELQKIGVDEKGLLESTRRDLAIAYFVNTKIAPDIKVSEKEIKKFYDQNPDKFRQDEQVRARHILIGVDNKAGIEAKKAAREKAEKLHKELEKGADFATLAKDNSTCPSNRQGGDLGYFGKGKMVPQFEQAAFALEPGGLSNVVETPYGYHIIKLVDRKRAEEIPLTTARNKIENYLRVQKTNVAIETFVGEARKNAKIDVLL